MRFLHVSDTHVGFSQYHRVTAEGLNQREQDFFDAFRRSIDLALAEGVDAVLHSGDLFDSVRPTNRAVAFAMAEIRRLGEAGIPFVAIAGNHETPKLRETGSVFRFLDFLPGTHAVYRGRYEVIRIGDAAFHCVPHAPSQRALEDELAKAAPDPDARFNVLTLHAGVVGVAEFRSGEFNEQSVNLTDLPPEFDYIALGHYHKPTQVTANAYYAGSTERASFREADEPKGCQLVDLSRGKVEFRELPAREMVTLPPFDAAPRAEIELAPALYKHIEAHPAGGKIARLRVEGIPPHLYSTLDFQRIRKLTEPALHFQIQYDVVRAEARGLGESTIGPLAEEFEGFFAKTPTPDLDRDRLKARAVEFLEEAEAALQATGGEDA